MSVANFPHLLTQIENLINSIPIGTKKKNEKQNTNGSSDLAQFMSPGSFTHFFLQRRPETMISLTGSIDNYFRQREEICEILSKIMSDYLVVYQRWEQRFYDPVMGFFEKDDLVAFQVREGTFHRNCTPWRFGLIESTNTSEVDAQTRSAVIRYISTPGESINKIILNAPRIIHTVRKCSNLIKLESSRYPKMKSEFLCNSIKVENLINSLVQKPNMTDLNEEIQITTENCPLLNRPKEINPKKQPQNDWSS